MYKIIKKDNELTVIENNNIIAKIKKDDFNSEIFSMKMGNLEILKNSINVIEVINFAKNNGFEHLTFKASTDSKVIINNVLKSGFLLVDTLVIYKLELPRVRLNKLKKQVDIRLAKKSDIPFLKKIAYDSFKIDRFHSDPNLDNNKANDYYAKWIENSVNGYAKEIFIALLNNEIVGFSTLNVLKQENNIKRGRVVLSAVSPKARGKNVYSSLIYETISYCIDDLDEILIGTQLNNYPVQKTWTNLGAYIIDSKHVFHLKID